MICLWATGRSPLMAQHRRGSLILPNLASSWKATYTGLSVRRDSIPVRIKARGKNGPLGLFGLIGVVFRMFGAGGDFAPPVPVEHAVGQGGVKGFAHCRGMGRLYPLHRHQLPGLRPPFKFIQKGLLLFEAHVGFPTALAPLFPQEAFPPLPPAFHPYLPYVARSETCDDADFRGSQTFASHQNTLEPSEFGGPFRLSGHSDSQGFRTFFEFCFHATILHYSFFIASWYYMAGQNFYSTSDG